MNDDASQHSALVRTIGQMPWWVQALLLVGSTFGMPVVILAFYLAQDAGLLDNPVAARLEELKGAAILHNATMQHMQQTLDAQQKVLDTEAQARRLRCVLRAKDAPDKKACFGKE